MALQVKSVKIDDFIFDEELIALGEDGVPFFDGQKNKAYMLYGKTWVNNHAHVLKAIQGLSHNKFLCYFLNQFDYHDYVNGGTRLKLTQANMRKIPVRFAPFSEQKIIAEKLDILLAQVDSTKARLEQIPQILKRFRQAVLAAAVNGKLADRLDGNRHWQEQQLSHVASHIVDCPHSTPKWSSEGKYCVRTTAFSPFYLDLSYQGYVDEETYQNRIQRLKPEPDDILYSREGTIGIACQIPKGVELCLGQRMVLIRASDKISSKYLTIVLNSNNILKIVRSKTMGSTAPRINMSDIKILSNSLTTSPRTTRNRPPCRTTLRLRRHH
ncbi:type I restriction-modification system [Klebsiella pneumoniae]|nr:type I restriction-modification system [Klebsiella pneumoniae]